MIRASAAMVRQIRSFMENSGLPWNKVRIRGDYDEDSRHASHEDSAEIVFLYGDRTVNVAIWAPGTILSGESLPLGRLVARIEGKVVKGPIDPVTWDRIVQFIKGEENGRRRAD